MSDNHNNSMKELHELRKTAIAKKQAAENWLEEKEVRNAILQTRKELWESAQNDPDISGSIDLSERMIENLKIVSEDLGNLDAELKGKRAQELNIKEADVLIKLIDEKLKSY